MPAAAVLTSIPGLDYLTLNDVTKTAATGTGATETVFEFIIPRGEARKFVRTAGRLTLGAKDTFAGNGALVDFVLAQTIANNFRGFRIPAILYFLTGGVKTYKTYTSNPAPGAGQFTVNFATNAVKTGDVAAALTDVVVLYPPVNVDGQYTVEVFNPTERRHETFGNGSIRGLHSMVQDDINSPWSMSETPWLPQDYILRVQVKTVSDVSVDLDNAYTQLELPFVRKPVQQLTKEEYAQTVGILGA
jgi:hypothetical protein